VKIGNYKECGGLYRSWCHPLLVQTYVLCGAEAWTGEGEGRNNSVESTIAQDANRRPLDAS
jgi:hypothetical protein